MADGEDVERETRVVENGRSKVRAGMFTGNGLNDKKYFKDV